MIAAAGPSRRTLATELPGGLRLPERFPRSRVVLPGILAVQGPPYRDGNGDVAAFCRSFGPDDPIRGFPLIVIVDDSEFTARSERNFLWVTFTRSDPAGRHRGDRRLHRQEALGLHRPAGHRRADQAPPRSSPGR